MTLDNASPAKKLRVLIADDFQETRRSIRLMLSMNPDVIVVAIAKDGKEAVEMAREHQPDILVMDINMPKIDGLAAFKVIREIFPATGCVIITGQRETGPLDMAMTLGVYEYLLKPFTIEELNNAVNRVAALVMENRQKLADANPNYTNEAAPVSAVESTANLKTLAEEFAKNRRTDDEALAVFEKLADDQACDLRWLRTLAMQYVIRQEWGKLKTLSERLEQQAGNREK
jgi:YesN/AraC family two-component response regulator